MQLRKVLSVRWSCENMKYILSQICWGRMFAGLEQALEIALHAYSDCESKSRGTQYILAE